MVIPSSDLVDLQDWDQKIKFAYRSTQRRNLRGLLFSHYFPYLHRLLHPQTKDDNKSARNVLSVEYQLRKQPLEHPALLAYAHLMTLLTIDKTLSITERSVVTGALHQALLGLLSNYQIGREAQSELDKLVHTERISLEDIQDLFVLPTIIAESLRLSMLTSPTELMYRTNEGLWYKKWFLPKNSIIIFDRDKIFTSAIIRSPSILVFYANLTVVSS